MKTRFHISVVGKEVVKKDSVVMVKGEVVQLPSITLPDLEIDVETEYQPEELVKNWGTIRQIIRELPEVTKDIQTFLSYCETVEEDSMSILKEVMKKVDTDNE